MKSTTKKIKLILLFCGIIIFSSLSGLAQNSTVNICDYGADNTGKIKSSAIINKLIDSLSNHRGGTIYFPAGNYLCGPIFMKSNITLLADAGADIHFSDDFDDYLPMVTSQWEGIRVKTFSSPIYAIDAQNIAIKGRGHFEGHGKKWWDYMYKIKNGEVTNSKWQKIFQEENNDLLKKNNYLNGIKNFLRPPMVLFYNCTNILIEGVSFSNPPFWTLVPVYCDNIVISGVTISNPGDSPNTDGIDPCSCRNMRISDCHISVGDDCIVLKSGRDEDGREAARPTENITITNCTMLNGHGGVVLGSEMSGDIRRVAISNCIFEGTDRGIRFKTMRGRGGIVEDITVNNIVMHNIVEEGIVLNMRYQKTNVEPLSERTPAFQNIHLSDISIRGAKKGIALYGLEERSVDQMSFHNISIQADKGIDGQYAQNLSFDQIQIKSSSPTPVTFDQCNHITINGIQLIEPLANSTYFTLTNCQSIKITDCFQTNPIESFLRYNENCKSIYLSNNIITDANKILNGPDPEKISVSNMIK